MNCDDRAVTPEVCVSSQAGLVITTVRPQQVVAVAAIGDTQ